MGALKPGLRGARNWASKQMRAASHTRKGFMRFLGGVCILFLLLIFLALWLGGFLPQIRQNMHDYKVRQLMAFGFVVEQIDVIGEGRVNEADIRAAIKISKGEYFFGADLRRAQSRAESLPWVDKAVVRRLWPNRIVVQLVEMEPYALWQHEGEFTVVNADGGAITTLENMPSVPQGLKTLIGAEAPQYARSIYTALEFYPEIGLHVERLIYRKNGRWDLYLQDGMVVKLPRENADQALENLSALQRKNQILNRQIAIIDLRLPDRIGLTPLLKPKRDQA